MGNDWTTQTGLESALWADELNDCVYVGEETDTASARAGKPHDRLGAEEQAETALERALWANDLNDIVYVYEDADEQVAVAGPTRLPSRAVVVGSCSRLPARLRLALAVGDREAAARASVASATDAETKPLPSLVAVAAHCEGLLLDDPDASAETYGGVGRPVQLARRSAAARRAGA
jgi:hypothetical protein